MNANTLSDLVPLIVAGVQDAYVYRENRYRAREWYPDSPQDGPEVILDIVRPMNYGLTRAAIPGEVSPSLKVGGMKRRLYRTAAFREAITFTEAEVMSLRRPGTVDQIQTLQEIITKHALMLRGRMDDRAEWMCWQANRGTIALAEGPINWTVTFPSPANLSFTPANLWTDPANMDPISDLIEIYTRLSDLGVENYDAYVNDRTTRLLVESDQITNLINLTFNAFTFGQMPPNAVTLDLINELFRRRLTGGIQFVEWKEGYHLETTIHNTIAAGGNTATVDDPAYFEVGDTLTLEAYNADNIETVQIQNIAGNVFTFTAGTTNGYDAGSTLHVRKRHIPDDETIVLPRREQDGTFNMETGPLGSLFLTPHPYGDGVGLANPSPGFRIEVQIPVIADPKHGKTISAVTMLAAKTNPTGVGIIQHA